jgi:hypothetical protein
MCAADYAPTEAEAPVRHRAAHSLLESSRYQARGTGQPKALVEFLDFSGDGTLAVPAGTLSTNGDLNHGVMFRGVYALLSGLQGSGAIHDVCFTHRASQRPLRIRTAAARAVDRRNRSAVENCVQFSKPLLDAFCASTGTAASTPSSVARNFPITSIAKTICEHTRRPQKGLTASRTSCYEHAEFDRMLTVSSVDWVSIP